MQIDFYSAGNDCLLIFTGLGGNTAGYQNKYIKIAENIRQKYGFSVFVAAVPKDCWEHPQQVFTQAVEHVLSQAAPKNLYIMGSSAGASLALWYSHLYPQIKRMLAVNPVLNLNYDRTKKGIESFVGEKIIVVTGEYDPCAVWLNLLPRNDKITAELIDGVDHVFTDKLDHFIALPERLFYN